MTEHDGSQLAEGQHVLMRLLPVRAQLMARRLQRFYRSGWDINGLALMQAEAAQLGEGSASLGLDAASRTFSDIAEILYGVLDREELPDEALGARLDSLAAELGENLPRPAQQSEAEAEMQVELTYEVVELTISTGEESDDASDATIDSSDVDDVDIWGDGVPLFAKPAVAVAKASSAATAAAAAATKPPASASATSAAKAGADAALTLPADFRIYHLTGYGPLSLELDQRFEAQGLEIELLEDVDELNELLSALPADLVLIDACFSDLLESAGTAVRLARTRSNKQALQFDLPLLLKLLQLDSCVRVQRESLRYFRWLSPNAQR